ncbi:chemokine-like protein TAFA-5 isoform X2 [Caretta caretta]|uniref:chemokine-like protein TAFA-5 isoform X2 n=1 Tax=Caretta caretta TaxID=8467 RepID=UPI003F4BFF16
MQLLKALWALAGAAICCFLIFVIHSQFLKEGQLAAGTCEIVTLDRDSSQPRRTIARQTARCACKKGQIAGTTRARPACVDARIIKTKQWCEMLPCLEGEGCDLLINKSGWTCTQPGGRIKTTTDRSDFVCTKCKLVSILEEKVQGLEKQVSTLRCIRKSEDFLDRHQDMLLQAQYSEDSEQTVQWGQEDGEEIWEHVTSRRRKGSIHVPAAQIQDTGGYAPLELMKQNWQWLWIWICTQVELLLTDNNT